MTRNASPSRGASPSRRSRVTPGRSSTSASFLPTSRLNRVDFPTLGRPIIAMMGSFAISGGPAPLSPGGQLALIVEAVERAAGPDEREGTRQFRCDGRLNAAAMRRDIDDPAIRAGQDQAIAGENQTHTAQPAFLVFLVVQCRPP